MITKTFSSQPFVFQTVLLCVCCCTLLHMHVHVCNSLAHSNPIGACACTWFEYRGLVACGVFFESLVSEMVPFYLGFPFSMHFIFALPVLCQIQ